MLEISWYILNFSISLHKIQCRAYWNPEQKIYFYSSMKMLKSTKKVLIFSISLAKIQNIFSTLRFGLYFFMITSSLSVD